MLALVFHFFVIVERRNSIVQHVLTEMKSTRATICNRNNRPTPHFLLMLWQSIDNNYCLIPFIITGFLRFGRCDYWFIYAYCHASPFSSIFTYISAGIGLAKSILYSFTACFEFLVNNERILGTFSTGIKFINEKHTKIACVSHFINHFLLLSFQVRDLVEKCTCPSQFPMVRVSEGKYRIGDTKVLIFVRVSIE